MSFRPSDETPQPPEPLNSLEWISLGWALEELQIDEEDLKRLVSLGEISASGNGLQLRLKKGDVMNHHSLWMSFFEVLEELQIDEEELKRLISNAELRGSRNGAQMRFKKKDVWDFKAGNINQDLIILTDRDTEKEDDALARQADEEDTVIHSSDDEDREEEENRQVLEGELQNLGILDRLKELGQWPATSRFYPQDGNNPMMFHSDKPFVITTKSSRRKAMVVYVEAEEGKYTPRLVYGSTTHIAIKALPRVMVDAQGQIRHFDKGDSEDSITLKTPYQLRLALTLNGVPEAGELSLYDQDSKLIKAISNPYPEAERHNRALRNESFYGFVEGVSMLASQASGDTAMGQNTIRIDAQYRKPAKVHLKDADESFDPIGECDEYLPTVLLRRVKFQHEKYGEVEAFFFRSENPSAATEYMVCRVPLPANTDPGRTHGIMIAAMDPARADHNSYLVSGEYFKDVEAVTVPLLEKRETVMRIGDDSGYHNAFMDKFGLVPSGNSHGDINMWNYLKHIPVIQAFDAKIAAIISPDRKKAFIDDVRPLLRPHAESPTPPASDQQRSQQVASVIKKTAAAIGALMLTGLLGIGVAKMDRTSEGSEDSPTAERPAPLRQPSPEQPLEALAPQSSSPAPTEPVAPSAPNPVDVRVSPPGETPPSPQTPEIDPQLQRRAEVEGLQKEARDFLNPSDLSVEDCDTAISGWAASPSHVDQAQRIAEWQELRRLAVLSTNINILLQRLCEEGENEHRLIQELDQLLNPQGMRLEAVQAAIADWEKPEFAHHPGRAQTLQQWGVWKFLLEFQEKVRASTVQRR